MSDYPNLWKRKLIQPRVKARAGHCCEQCGMEFHPHNNLAVKARRKDGRAFVGTVHHIDHDKANCSMANLVFLCQSCHYRLHIWDWKPFAPLPLPYMNRPPRWMLARGTPYTLNAQLMLWSDQ